MKELVELNIWKIYDEDVNCLSIMCSADQN
jgi:hypothetical protein